ncbi:MAG TPA: hypothetical protein VM865_00685 [Acidobacteriaceae bacterium]|nr:hypothetical protein [Acidobacteriaceae bacterium]
MMTTEMVIGAQVEAAAKSAGLTVLGTEAGTDFSGGPTLRFTLARAGETAKTQALELSAGLDLTTKAELSAGLATYLAETEKRLRNPRPDCYLTLGGLPLSFGKFAWPFHGSTSGADTYIVHGETRLEDGGESVLHAKISAAMTVTFREVVPALEQPYAEGFIYNAVRKTMDQGQLELVKSGNRQPVPVTTRYYSTKQHRFIFNDTDEQQRRDFLAGKVYWMSGMLGGGAPVWMADPRDAQYLNTTPEELIKAVGALGDEGVLALSEGGQWAAATAKLQEMGPQFEAGVQDALSFIKPSFNESMRAGHTNM